MYRVYYGPYLKGVHRTPKAAINHVKLLRRTRDRGLSIWVETSNGLLIKR
jgi:hypothetical protein